MRIALTHTEMKEKHQFYVDWLKGNDDIEVVTLSLELNNADEVHKCDALVLSGGVDIHPSYYNGKEEYPNMPVNGWRKDRDEFEKHAFVNALQESIPILGICRGLQLINVILNGTLVQDLGDEKLNKVHRGGPDKQHEINIAFRTTLHEMVGVTRGEVNSAHHQAIADLGFGLQANCTAEDGTIEGIEWASWRQKPFLLAVQWHPERMFQQNLQDSPLSATLRNKFIEEIVKSKASKQ